MSTVTMGVTSGLMILSDHDHLGFVRPRTQQADVVRRVGRRSGRMYQTPVVAARCDDRLLIALPYGERTDWLKNVLARGSAAIVINGHAYEVDRPQVIPTAEATTYFRPRERRIHRQFRVDSALQVHQRPEARR